MTKTVEDFKAGDSVVVLRGDPQWMRFPLIEGAIHTVAEVIADTNILLEGDTSKVWWSVGRFTLVERADPNKGWQTVTQEEADVLNRLGVEYVSRFQIKIKEKK